MAFGGGGAGKNLAMRSQREPQPQDVTRDQQQRQHQAELLDRLWAVDTVGRHDGRGDQKRHDCNKEQAGLKACPSAVEFLQVVAQPAQKEGCTQHEQRIGDDGPGNRGLDQRVLSGGQCGQGDDQLGQVAKGCVDQPACGIAGAFRHGLGRKAEQGGQRNNGKNGKQKQQRVGVGPDNFDDQDDRNKDQQPKERVTFDLVKEARHDIPFSGGGK